MLTARASSPQILLKKGLIDVAEFDFLLRFPVESTDESPVSFLSTYAWGAVKVKYMPLTFVMLLANRSHNFCHLEIVRFFNEELRRTCERH